MSKTNTLPFDGQAKVPVAVNLSKVDIATNYAVTQDVPGTTVISNVTSTDNIPEKVTYRYQTLDKVSSTLDPVNGPSTKRGYQFVIKDEFICRTADDFTSTVYDDPVVAYLTVRTTKGANLLSGNDILDAVMHLMSHVISVNAEGKLDASQILLDRIMRGATKPRELV